MLPPRARSRFPSRKRRTKKTLFRHRGSWMTPISHTLFTLTLFFALAVLKLWSDRRHRIPRAVRAGATEALSGGVKPAPWRAPPRPGRGGKGLVPPRNFPRGGKGRRPQNFKTGGT